MASGITPRKPGDPGYIVAWRYKQDHKAGKELGKVMTWGEAQKAAEAMAAKNPEITYWAEPQPEKIKPHG